MIQQCVLSSAELSQIVAAHVSQTLPEGTTANAHVQFVGTHPKQNGNVTERYLERGAKDNRLAEVSAIVTLTPTIQE